MDLIDLRFGTPQRPGFAMATALVNPDGLVRDAPLGPIGLVALLGGGLKTAAG